MLAMEFFACGTAEFGEPGVFMMVEENAAELTANVRSLGFDLDRLVTQKKIALDRVHIDHREMEEAGEYDLKRLLIWLRHAFEQA